MKYVHAVHVTIKQRKGFKKFLLNIVKWLYKGRKVTVVLFQKGGKEYFANAMFGVDTVVLGKLSKVMNVELVYPWDKLVLAMVRYRDSFKRNNIRIASMEEVMRYAKK